jgi:hypothetical protein
VNDTEEKAILETYHAILKNLLKMRESMAVAYTATGDPLTGKQYVKEVVAASQRVKSGQFIRHEELEKQVENW